MIPEVVSADAVVELRRTEREDKDV